MLKQITTSERQAWAEKLGVSEQYLYQCLTARRDMGPAEARRIEQASGGVLTRQMLCQRTWQGIWPELAADNAAKPAAPLKLAPAAQAAALACEPAGQGAA